jgi:glucose/arabinose dehydrogenase
MKTQFNSIRLLAVLFASVTMFINSHAHKIETQTLLKEKDVIWGFDFLNEKEIIFSLRGGYLKILNLENKQVKEIKGLPKVFAKGQGGLLDVRISPKNKNQIYFTYSLPSGKDSATTALAKATLVGDQLTEFINLYTSTDPTDEVIHFGSRIEFDQKGEHLFFTIGDRNQREKVQDLNSSIGKVIRLKLDGSNPKDNPFSNFASQSGQTDINPANNLKVSDPAKESLRTQKPNSKSARPEIWSYGHRSPQGLSRHPLTGEVWLSEMGPRGGDELNLIQGGVNYGWPEVTYGREYWGPRIGVEQKENVKNPVAYWVPSISPSGMDFYRGDKFKKIGRAHV